MTAINFRERWADKVENGKKRQTIRKIRADGKVPWRVGGKLQLYTGQRTKECRKLGDAICTCVAPIHIDTDCLPYISVAGINLSMDHRDDLAFADGFKNVEDLIAWFGDAYGLPFDGWLIQWKLEGG